MVFGEPVLCDAGAGGRLREATGLAPREGGRICCVGYEGAVNTSLVSSSSSMACEARVGVYCPAVPGRELSLVAGERGVFGVVGCEFEDCGRLKGDARGLAGPFWFW